MNLSEHVKLLFFWAHFFSSLPSTHFENEIHLTIPIFTHVVSKPFPHTFSQL